MITFQNDSPAVLTNDRYLPGAAEESEVFRFPLSHAQERLWFLDQLEPGTAAYNVRVAVRLEGVLAVGALGASLREIVRRHETLRTRFVVIEGEPQQEIRAEMRLNLPVVDLREIAEGEREQAAEGLAREAAQTGFELAAGPLLRSVLLRLGEAEHVLLLTMHHIITDGWSMGVMFGEISQLYQAYEEGRESPLAELGVQYADYAVWQRGWLQGEVLEGQLAYWREQLADAPAVLELPTDRVRPALQGHRGEREQVVFNATLAQQLKEFSQQAGATLFMTLLAAFQALLSRYSGEEDIVVGTPIAGRRRAEVEPLIGLFLNTLVMRTKVSGKETFAELLARVRRVCLGAYTHQDLPFELLLDELKLERSLSQHPLFQVMLQWQPGVLQSFEMNGLKASPRNLDNETAKFDLTLALGESEGQLVGSLEYNTDILNRSSVKRLLAHFTTFLTAVVAQPGVQLETVSLLGPEERVQLLCEWNQTAAEFPDECIHEQFEQQVRRTPQRVAVVCGEEHWTYEELNERANQLAHHLQGRAVGPEVLVAVCLERSLEMVLALLAILKTGAAYVPLDPTYPQARLRFMLEDAEVGVLLTTENVRSGLGEIEAQVMCLDKEAGVIAACRKDNPESDACGKNLAYVIYTSGSTGFPKGVEITHAGLSNFMNGMSQQPGLTAKDVLVALTTLSFDIAALELFLPLMVGARVVLASREVASDGVALGRLLREVGGSVLQATPVSWRMLMESGWKAERPVKALCGGEALSVELAQDILGQGCELWNMYGPTETCIWSVVERVERVERGVFIGRPIQNTQVYVLDTRAEPVPIGLVGELYIGGTGVARGYHKRAELTGERFVPDPFGGSEGARLYRTGDRVRWRAEGRLEFCGRADTQVKLRGHRIELKEIEAVLNGHGQVEQSVVVVSGAGRGEQQLVAYVAVSGGGAESLVSELRQYLKERVPDYMVPGQFVILPQLPLTLNGKVDRQRLPEPPSQGRGSAAYQPPGTAIEEVLCAIWSSLLHLDHPGIHDNFFELGGHSLLVVQVTSRASKAFNLEIPTRSMFEYATIHSLAKEIEGWLRSGSRVTIPPILPVKRDQALPLSHGQERLWFLDQLEPGTAAYNIRVAVRLEGVLAVGALGASLREIVRRHETLRTRFVVIEGEPRQEIRAEMRLNLPVVDLSEIAEGEREQAAEGLAREAAQTGFELAAGPLLRSVLLRLGEAEHVLLLTMHHIITDGWSMGVMFGEISKLYQAYEEGRESPLAELGVQYADYAVWQRGWLQGEVLEGQLAYWREQLADAPAVLELPTDHPRSVKANKHWGRPQVLELSSELTNRLKEISRSASVTLFMTLLAAFQVLLSRYSGGADVVVGTPTAGRNKTETHELIGFFINTLVLRTSTKGNPSFGEFLLRVRETCLGAYVHQEVPVENLVKELKPNRDLGHNPLFQVVFQLQNAPMEALTLSHLNVSPMVIEGGMINLDLSVSIKETAAGLKVTLRYDDDLFDESTILRMLGHYQQLLESIAADVGQRLSQVAMMRGAELEQVLREWNETEVENGVGKCLQELFEEQVRRRPELTAVVSEAGEVSYGELNERANQLAHYLRGQGVGAEVVVGVCLERSVEMVVALLAILKAGGAYVPLDPEYPAERVRWMWEDAEARVLITEERLGARLETQGIRVVCLDRAELLLAGESRENPELVTEEGNAAYIIYTSGSSGKPKGVVVAHGSVVNFVETARAAYGIEETDRVLQFASISFDTSAEEIYPCLTSGATLVLRGPEMISSVTEFFTCCRDLGITVLDLPTAYWHELIWQLQYNDLLIPASFRLVIIGGEQAFRERWSSWQKRVGTASRLINTYGPTEATIVTTMYDAAKDAEEDLRVVPIGGPIANATIYILDKQLEPVPIRVIGEIYIGGQGLAREYLKRPELTAECFVPNRFGETSGARLYRTGDLGRYRIDGQIEYVGRSDNQVKVRGFRIEPGEIEATLNECKGVRASALVVRTYAPGDYRLVAYIASELDHPPTTDELREYLKGKLPDHMMPSVFMMLDSLPQTAGGKIDRRALPAPDNSGNEPKRAFVPPRTPAEKELALIWCELLSLKDVGIYDNFFEIGGHSLLLTRLASRINNRFQLNLTLRALFDAPTVLAMTEAIVAAQIEREDGDEINVLLAELHQLTADEIRVLSESST